MLRRHPRAPIGVRRGAPQPDNDRPERKEHAMPFEDILYELRNGVAWITINRPEKLNAFRGTTCDELI
ncbi:MAG: hypothetical protein AMXMBFR66_11890 [Pseudomonadota bacterium]